LEQRVVERTRELGEINDELNAFTYTVSHDLRAPLRAMEGFARILLDDYAEGFDDDGKRYALRIVTAAERMEALINDLLTYSRLTRSELIMRPVDLPELTQQCVKEVSTDVPVEWSIAPSLPPVLAEPAVLRQVLINLVTNAAKFQTQGQAPRISISIQESGKRVRVTVIDNGIGIAPEHHERIFRVFERLHGQESYAGTGVGLAIVRKGIERMGGACGVESEPGKGSHFWIELPCSTGGR
jgi:signal transduction histidine kinase